MPLSAAEEQHAASRTAIESVAARTGATVLDLFAPLCPGDVCSTLQGEIFVYRDSTHISPEYSLSLAPEFITVLTSPVTE
jgi:hypothetical protein